MVAKRQRKKGNPAKYVAPLMLSPKRQEAKKATKIEEIPEIRCLSRLVKREKATKREEKAKLGCLFPRHRGNKEKQVITEVKGNAPAAAPRRQDAGNKVVD